MSIADKITQLTTIRGDIRTALAGKGVSASDHDFADFAADIGSISTGGLPSGYTAVDWIEGTGTQFINTGYTPTANDYFRITFQISSDAVSWTDVLVTNGSFGSGNAQRRLIQLDDPPTTRILYAGGASTSLAYFSLTANDIITFISNASNQQAQKKLYDSIYYLGSSAKSSPAGSEPYYIFGRADKASQGKACKCRVLEFVCGASNSITAKMLPCVQDSTNKAGMYDIIRNEFYGNANTGDDFIIPT